MSDNSDIIDIIDDDDNIIDDAKSANLDAELDALFHDGVENSDGSDSDNNDAIKSYNNNIIKSNDEDTVLVEQEKKKKDVSKVDFSNEQLARDEVFSRHYHPTKDEEEFVNQVVAKLGVNRHALTTSTTVLKLLSTDSNKKDAEDPDYRGRNIVLKRGIVTMGGDEKELLLLTHGFIVAKRPLNAANNKGRTSTGKISLGYSMIEMVLPKFDSCHVYQTVAWVKDLWQAASPSKESYSIQIQGPDHKKKELRFDVASLDEKKSWLHAWERVLLQNRSHAKLSPEQRDARTVGWQHALLQTSLYTAAVTGQSFFGEHHLAQANALDEYNGLAPLHYAALHNQVHVIDELLCVKHQTNHCDVDVELQDADGRTPMYYAERDNMVPAMEALRRGGAQVSAALQREQHGALVEEARELEEASKHEQEHSELMAGAAAAGKQKGDSRGPWSTEAISGLDEEQLGDKVVNHQTQARSAQSHMKDALSGIQDRGDKINDLGEKTAQLEDNAAEYQSLAAQMRQKLEKQNKSLNFLNPFAK